MACSSIFHPSIPVSEHSLSWEIDNFHLTSLTVRGPAFQPISWFVYKFCLEVEFKSTDAGNYLIVKLIALSAYALDFKIRWSIRLSNKLRQISSVVDRETTFHFKKEAQTNLMCFNCHGNSLSDAGLADDKLIITGTITFSNYHVSSTICKPPVEPKRLSETSKELSKHLKRMYEGGLASDIVTFQIGNKQLAAHKAILCSHSPVFEKMFEHDMQENTTNKVTIDDADFGTFNVFLGFLYAGVLKEDCCDNVLSLYSVAKKYQVGSLGEACFPLIKNKLTVESACDTLVLADLHEDKELKDVVMFYIRENYFDLSVTEKWFEFVTSNPGLKQEVLDYVKGKSK